MPDPWQYLLDAPAISADAKKVFRAAQSSIAGLYKLSHMAEGCGTLSTDWFEENRQARIQGDTRRQKFFAEKIAGKIGLSKRIEQEIAAKRDPILAEQLSGYRKTRQAQLAHRCRWQRKSEYEPLLKLLEIEKAYPLEYHLVESWPCFANGPLPGLMYWSNQAITKWTFTLLGTNRLKRYANLGRDTVKKTRQRLELVPVSDTSPIVWDVDCSLSTDGCIDIKGWNRKREIVFEGKRGRPRP